MKQMRKYTAFKFLYLYNIGMHKLLKNVIGLEFIHYIIWKEAQTIVKLSRLAGTELNLNAYFNNL